MVSNIDERNLAEAMGYDKEYSDDEAKKVKKVKNVNDDDANDTDEDWYKSLKNA